MRTSSARWAVLAITGFGLGAALFAPGCASGGGTVDASLAVDAPPRTDGGPSIDAAPTCASDAECDDGDLCNGAETCVSGACAAGTTVNCDDAVSCTVDTCDPGTAVCAHTANDALCTEGLACDRIDGCVTPAPCVDDAGCDDGIFCNGAERCDPAFGCRRGDVPNCADGYACTTDVCDTTTDACVSTPADTECDDSLVCNGAERCVPTDPAADGQGCLAGTPLACDDLIDCTVDACDELAGGCVAPPSNARCDDAVYCNGAEICDPSMGGCAPGAPPVCEDTIPCTVGRCDATTDACVFDANDAACSDGRACNGEERCDPTGTTGGTGCVSGAAIDCSDGLVCTTDTCAEPGMCTHGGSDADGDGFVAVGCGAGTDCNDASPRINPGAAELCDGIDNDCSGRGPSPAGVDDGPGMECPFGSAPRACTTACLTAGTQPCDGTCRLGLCRASAETCNECDDDGDGLIDEPGGGSPVQCRAGDVRSCVVSGCGTIGTQTCDGGCTWGRCAAVEVCNGCDDDGNGVIDNGYALGGACTVGIGACTRTGSVVCRSDGAGTVCSVSAGAPVTEACNGIDDDCDGLTDEPFTELGRACSVGVGACARTGAYVCRTDGSGTLCGATAGSPVAEVCNGLDDNCNGTIDDGADAGACDGLDTDLCLEGTNRCMSGTLVCDDTTSNNVEVCTPSGGTPADENCNGTVDEGCDCAPGATRACYTGPAGTQGVGVCVAGTQTCVAGTGGVGATWGMCVGAVVPTTEACNGRDDDCNGAVDNGNPGGGAACDGTDTDLCQEGTFNCTGGTLVCSDMTGSSVEVCNGIDDDCNGTIDNGNPGGGAACDGPDTDRCNEGTFSCTGGTLVCSDTSSSTVEACNNLDDDCNGLVDDGNPGGGAACDGTDTDLCNEGIRVCTAGAIACNDATSSTTEVCGNGIDDDCNPASSDVCSILGDTCASPIALSGTGGSRSDTLVGASAQTTDCGGPEVFYSVTVSVPSIVYLSTLSGTSIDTRIAYRGASCGGAPTQCVDDSCGTLQTHVVQLIPAGTSYFSVHTFLSTTTPGPYGLTYVVLPAAGGTNTLVTLPVSGTTGSFTGTTSGTSRVAPSCSSTSTAPENGYYWMQCPSDTRSYSGNTCTGTTWDSVLHMLFNGTSIACNDDGCGYPTSTFTGASATGAGLVQLFVDGYSTASGAYTLNVTY